VVTLLLSAAVGSTPGNCLPGGTSPSP